MNVKTGDRVKIVKFCPADSSVPDEWGSEGRTISGLVGETAVVTRVNGDATSETDEGIEIRLESDGSVGTVYSGEYAKI